MRGATAKVEKTNSPATRLGCDDLEHYAVPFFNILSFRPVHTQVRIAVPLQAVFIVRDYLEILLFLHLTELALSIGRKIIRAGKLARAHDPRVALPVENSSAEE